MPESEFGIRAKAFSEALLADRAVQILRRVMTRGSLDQSATEERDVLQRAKCLVEESIKGLSAVRRPSGEEGFLAWMNSLSAYRMTFAAMVRGRMVQNEADPPKVLKTAQDEVSGLLAKGKVTSCNTALCLFENLAEIRSDEALTSPSPIPEKLPRPEELSS